MSARVLNVEDQGMWRGRHSWQITMADADGTSKVQAYGDNETEALADADGTFRNRRIYTDAERAVFKRSSDALRKGIR